MGPHGLRAAPQDSLHGAQRAAGFDFYCDAVVAGDRAGGQTRLGVVTAPRNVPVLLTARLSDPDAAEGVPGDRAVRRLHEAAVVDINPGAPLGGRRHAPVPLHAGIVEEP